MNTAVSSLTSSTSGEWERISNIAYNIVNGECSPVNDQSAPVYITIGDGGNRKRTGHQYDGAATKVLGLPSRNQNSDLSYSDYSSRGIKSSFSG